MTTLLDCGLLETFFQWFYRMHRRTSLPRTVSAGGLIFRWSWHRKRFWSGTFIGWCVVCPPVGPKSWPTCCLTIILGCQVRHFVNGRWLDPSWWLVNTPRDFRNQDFARQLRDTAEELCQDIIDLTPVLVACQVKCAPKKPLPRWLKNSKAWIVYDVKIAALKFEHRGGQYPETIQKLY